MVTRQLLVDVLKNKVDITATPDELHSLSFLSLPGMPSEILHLYLGCLRYICLLSSIYSTHSFLLCFIRPQMYGLHQLPYAFWLLVGFSHWGYQQEIRGREQSDSWVFNVVDSCISPLKLVTPIRLFFPLFSSIHSLPLLLHHSWIWLTWRIRHHSSLLLKIMPGSLETAHS